MPNKLTDAEVKKALEDKIEFENFDENEYAVIDIEKLKNALDLINRYEAEVERLNNNISAMATTLSNSARATRHEAYKEAFEKVKGKARLVCTGHGEAGFVVDILDIDNIFNELVGNGDGKRKD